MAEAGARIQRILQLVAEEAAEVKARAEAEISASKAGADQDIAALQARADDQITALRAQASREAKSLRDDARRQCEQLEWSPPRAGRPPSRRSRNVRPRRTNESGTASCAALRACILCCE